MGSESREARLAQLARVEARLAERTTVLAARGIEGKAAARNAVLRKLEADVRRARRRIAAMDAAAAHVADVAGKGAEVKVKVDKAAAKKGKGQAAKPDGKGARPARSTKPAKKK